MKKISFLIVVLLTFASYTVAQKNINLVLGTSVGFSHYYAPQMLFINTTYQVGAELEFNKGSLTFSGVYNLNLINDLKDINEYRSKQLLSFLGINTRYRILNNTKIISPTLSLSLFTEVRKKSREYIDYKTPRMVKNSDGNGIIYNDLYLSTPFLGNISMGFQVNLYKGLSMIVEGGYGYRYVKYMTQEYRNKDILISTTNHSEYFQSFDFKVGFSYTFLLTKAYTKKSKK